MGVEENKALLRRYWEDLWDRRDFAAADSLFAPDFVFHAPVVPGIIIAHVADGKIQDIRGVFDGIGLLQQLGVIRAPPPP